MANYIGNMWSSLEELDERGALKIVANEEAIAEQIICFLLTRVGEDPFNLDFGLDINIFENLNDFDPELWAFYVEGKLRQHIPGISGLNVIADVEPIDGRARVRIDYGADLSVGTNSLTFPYHQYAGVPQGATDLTAFIESIALNGDSFRGLSDK